MGDKNYNAIDVAIAIIKECRKQGISDINITKIHKLLYIVYGAFMCVYNKKLFPELPSYFQYGPIFKSLQTEYKRGNFNLNRQAEENDVLPDENLRVVVEKAIQTFGSWSAQTLSNWSHREGSAWSKVDKMSDYWGVDIDEDLIKGEFSKIVTIEND